MQFDYLCNLENLLQYVRYRYQNDHSIISWQHCHRYPYRVCVFFVRLSLRIDTANNNNTNNIVTLVYFSTLTAYDAVTDVDYTVFSKGGEGSNTPSI